MFQQLTDDPAHLQFACASPTYLNGNRMTETSPNSIQENYLNLLLSRREQLQLQINELEKHPEQDQTALEKLRVEQLSIESALHEFSDQPFKAAREQISSMLNRALTSLTVANGAALTLVAASIFRQSDLSSYDRFFPAMIWFLIGVSSSGLVPLFIAAGSAMVLRRRVTTDRRPAAAVVLLLAGMSLVALASGLITFHAAMIQQGATSPTPIGTKPACGKSTISSRFGVLPNLHRIQCARNIADLSFKQ